MGRIMAAVYDRMMRGAEEACLGAWRRELLAGARGTVLEIGAGTGANLPLYPAAVTRLVATEPDPHMRAKLAAKAAGNAHLRLEVGDGDACALPFADGGFDVVVATLVLCSVSDLGRAVAEIHRVLAERGRLLFLEHVAADTRPRRLRWQRRLEPLWRCCAGNCHLTRRTEAALIEGGFTLETIRRESMRRAMPLVRPTIRGVAVKG